MDSTSDADYSAALPLEIDEATAIEADNLLREFAELAMLETALVVDRSGALVAGISAEADVTVEVISALVAGASGAMRALVSRLGESGSIESLHLGEERLIYLKEINDSFILVAVTETERPAALVRQSALSIEARLSEVLRGVVPSSWPEPDTVLLHRIRPSVPAAIPSPEPEDAEDDAIEEEALPLPIDSLEPDPDESFADLDLFTGSIEETEPEDDPEEEPEPSEDSEFEDETEQDIEDREPNEVLEPIFDDDPEVVIEPAAQALPLPVDSPFEADEEEDEEDEWEESDEPLDEEDDLPLTLSPPLPASPVFELEDDEEDFVEEEENDAEETPVWESDEDSEFESEFDSGFNPFEEEEEEESPAGNVFEFDDEEDDVPEPDDAEVEAEDEPESENIREEIEELFPEGDEEEESRSSGPFYF